MKHKIEIAPNFAICIDGERVIGSKPHGLYLTTEMIVSDEDLKRLSDRCLEVISDRKTEPNSSKKPNNCETCRFDDKYGEESICSGCSRHYSDCYEPKTEQLDKDTNVRSKEPQIDWHYSKQDGLWYPYKHEDEPQTDIEIARAIVHKAIDDAVIAEDAYPDLRQKMHDAVDNYEPQTDCAWK